MQFTIDQQTSTFIWTGVIRNFLEKTAGNSSTGSIELRFVEANALRLIRQASKNHYTLEDIKLSAHKLMVVPLENRYTVTNEVESVERGLKTFIDQNECKILIIEFKESNIRLHLYKADEGLTVWAEVYNEEFHRRETVPSIQVITTSNVNT